MYFIYHSNRKISFSEKLSNLIEQFSFINEHNVLLKYFDIELFESNEELYIKETNRKELLISITNLLEFIQQNNDDLEIIDFKDEVSNLIKEVELIESDNATIIYIPG